MEKTSLVCNSDFAYLKDHKIRTFRKKYKAETFSHDEGIFDLQTLQILTCYAAPNNCYYPFK